MYIDAHSHWADLRWQQNTDQIKNHLNRLKAQNINFFMQAGVDPSDWERQLKLKKLFPDSFGLCFGLHPYKVSEMHRMKEHLQAEEALDQLSLLLPQAMALGETGLDFREKILLGVDKSTSTLADESMAFQIEMFENQIQLATALKKPLVLHIVRAHEKAIEILKIWSPSAPTKYSGIVHAFTGSYEIATEYIKLGFLISIGTAVTYDKNHKLHKCVQKLPLDSFVIETDAPDQPMQNQAPTELNQPENLLKVAEKIAELKGITQEEVGLATADNFKRVFSAKLFS